MKKKYKRLPRKKVQPKRNKDYDMICGIVIGIIIVIIIFAIILENNMSNKYYTNETCQELIINESIIASQTIIFEIINYTQSTGNILYFSENGTINEVNIVEQCNFYNELNLNISN